MGDNLDICVYENGFIMLRKRRDSSKAANDGCEVPSTWARTTDKPLTGTSTIKVPIWTRNAILCLISLYEQNEKKFKTTTVRNETVWASICEDLEQHGYQYSINQVKDKFKYLKLKYRKTVNNGETSPEAVRFEYFNEMDKIFGKQPIVAPFTIASSLRCIRNIAEETCTADPLEESVNPVEVPLKKKKSNFDTFLEEYREQSRLRREARERHHQENLEVKKKVADALCKFLKR